MSIIINQRRYQTQIDPDLAVVVRAATAGDNAELRRLAELDTSPMLQGRMIVAEAGGRIRAAVSLDDGRAISNPFERSAEIAALVEMRAAQLRGAERRRARIVARTSRRSLRAAGQAT